jgi:tRNA U34 5-methylaminomethyl-2-thiouridine-forming methyltransferase MnmC
LKRHIITTKDGSKTIHIPEWNEQYHSTHGAIQEARHVYLQMGFYYFLAQNKNTDVAILEMGFGTGLNALLTMLEAQKNKVQVSYTAIEAFPVEETVYKQLNYAEQVCISSSTFIELHKSNWEETIAISPYFKLTKQNMFFEDIRETDQYNIIYFDAFGARVQPELWTAAIFKKMYLALKPNGILVTYAAKGSVRRAMQQVGFLVERLPGPPGKREMLRGTREHS